MLDLGVQELDHLLGHEHLLRARVRQRVRAAPTLYLLPPFAQGLAIDLVVATFELLEHLP